MQQGEPDSEAVPCPSCGGELGRGLSECPHCGSMAPLRISLDPMSPVKWLVRILVFVAVGVFVKILLLS